MSSGCGHPSGVECRAYYIDIIGFIGGLWKTGGPVALFQGIRLDARFALAGGLFRPVLFHPGFVAFARGGVATGEGKCRDFGIRNLHAVVRVLRKHSNKRGCERVSGRAIEDVAFDFRSIFARDGHVAAILERFFERGAKIGVGGEFGHPAFDVLPRRSGCDFELFGIKRCVCSGLAAADVGAS